MDAAPHNQLTNETASATLRTDARELPDWYRAYLMKRRQTLIMELGEIEDQLGLERSIVPRRKR